jgi:hypothetical protein
LNGKPISLCIKWFLQAILGLMLVLNILRIFNEKGNEQVDYHKKTHSKYGRLAPNQDLNLLRNIIFFSSGV